MMEPQLARSRSSMEVSDEPTSTTDILLVLDSEVLSVNMYITRPPAGGPNNAGTAVVYATDVFGIQLPQNKL